MQTKAATRNFPTHEYVFKITIILASFNQKFVFDVFEHYFRRSTLHVTFTPNID